MNKQHELKCWPEFFQSIVQGIKTFDLRRNDRGFQTGDMVLLREWDRHTATYTGNTAQFRISYMMADNYSGIVQGYAILAIAELNFQIKPKRS